MKLFKIEVGDFYVDGGAVFGVVPKKVWQKRYPCNDDNMCKMSMRCLLIDTGSKRILIDTGAGTKQLKYLDYYGFVGGETLSEKIEKLGYRCDEITDVVFTHLHFDHCGACTDFDKESNTYSLTFPDATHWVGAEQWANFMEPNVREGDSYFKENVVPVMDAGKVCLVSDNTWICDEVELRLFNGHTLGQLVTYVHALQSTYIYLGDVIPVAASISIAWVSAYDTYPVKSMEEKVALLTEAVEKRQILFFEHDYYTECCTVKMAGGKVVVDERLELH